MLNTLQEPLKYVLSLKSPNHRKGKNKKKTKQNSSPCIHKSQISLLSYSLSKKAGFKWMGWEVLRERERNDIWLEKTLKKGERLIKELYLPL